MAEPKNGEKPANDPKKDPFGWVGHT
ncbi:MAG: hypothetical protein JWM74_125, partial [Myxococcaceae bacterium]|nr:hypothetical protein [Myxococcaceae bacterium]